MNKTTLRHRFAKGLHLFFTATLLAALVLMAVPPGVAQAQDPVDAVFANGGVWGGERNRFCAGDGAGGFACSDVSTDTNTSVAVALTSHFTLTVNKAGSGTGTVTSDPAGIFCGGDCTEIYIEGTVVTLKAYPGVKSYLASWSGDCISTGKLTSQVAIMDDDKTCTANFGYPVGGIVVPVDKLGLVAPWMGLAALAGLVALGVVLARRRKTTTK